jgi:hypothetical protein
MNEAVTGGYIRGRTYSSSRLVRTRSGQLFAPPPQPDNAPETEIKTELGGLGPVTSFVFNEFEPINGLTPFELVIDGKTVWSGMGNDRADALLDAIMTITGEAPEIPDN